MKFFGHFLKTVADKVQDQRIFICINMEHASLQTRWFSYMCFGQTESVISYTLCGSRQW